MMDKISFLPEGSEEAVDFFVLAETRINGMNYILVTDSQEGDGEALILKDLAAEDAPESLYEIVSEDDELSAVAKVFEEILDDIEIER